VVPVELCLEVSAKQVKPRPNVPLDLLRPKNFGDCARRLPPPDLELEQPIPGRVVALSEEEIVFGIRIDVIDAPSVSKHLHGAFEAAHAQRLGCAGKLALDSSEGIGMADDSRKRANPNENAQAM
jgi:hypothetical protein